MSLSIGELVGYVGLETGPAEKAADKITGLLGGLGNKWGASLALGGAAAGAAFATSLTGAMNLEPSRDRVAAALDLTAEQAKRAGDVSGKLFANAWGDSAAEVDGAVEAVMSSIKGMRTASSKDLERVTTSALTLATAMEVDVVRAAQVAGNMVANGLAKNGTEAFDLLGKAMSKVPVQLREDVMDAADEYGQFFNQLGIKGPQAMAMLAAGAEKGMYGIDKAGDAVKEFTIRATDGSKNTSTALESLGLDFHKVENQLLSGGPAAQKAFGQVVSALLQVDDPAQQAQTALALFGTPLEDLGTKDIPKFLASLQAGEKGMGKWRGTTERMGKTLNDNASTNLTTFKRGLQTAFVNMIGGQVLPKVTELTGSLATGLGPALTVVGDGLKRTTKFLSEHKGVAIALGVVIAALTAVTMAHSAVMAVAAAGGMVQWLKQTRLISSAIRVWTAVQWALNAAMAANPITLILIALAALAVGVAVAYAKVGWFRDGVNAAFGMVKSAAGAVLGFFKAKWPLILAILTGPIGVATLLIAKNWDKIKAGASSVVSWIKGIPGKIGALGKSFGDAGAALLQRFIDGMKNAAGIITGLAGNIWNAVKGLLNGAIDKINAALEFKISLPLGKSIGINPPDIPHLATGGRATGATLAMIGEGREPESVLPDSVLRGLLERAHDAGAASAQQPRDGGRNAPLIGAVHQQAGESTDELAERLWFMTRTRG